ncbi:hypothetical protein D3C84_608180 [compost metagenome]
MGDLGAHQAFGGQERVEDEQRHRAQGPGTDGRQRHHHTEQRPRADRQQVQAPGAQVVVVARVFMGEGQQPALEEDGQRRQ